MNTDKYDPAFPLSWHASALIRRDGGLSIRAVMHEFDLSFDQACDLIRDQIRSHNVEPHPKKGLYKAITHIFVCDWSDDDVAAEERQAEHMAARREHPQKLYLDVITRHTPYGHTEVIKFRAEDGLRSFKVDETRDIRSAPSLKAGGRGIRHLVMVYGHELAIFNDGAYWYVEADDYERLIRSDQA